MLSKRPKKPNQKRYPIIESVHKLMAATSKMKRVDGILLTMRNGKIFIETEQMEEKPGSFYKVYDKACELLDIDKAKVVEDEDQITLSRPE